MQIFFLLLGFCPLRLVFISWVEPLEPSARPMLPFWSKFLLFRQFLEHALSRIDKGKRDKRERAAKFRARYEFFFSSSPLLRETFKKQCSLEAAALAKRKNLFRQYGDQQRQGSAFVSSRSVCAIFLVNGNVSLSPFALKNLPPVRDAQHSFLPLPKGRASFD